MDDSAQFSSTFIKMILDFRNTGLNKILSNFTNSLNKSKNTNWKTVKFFMIKNDEKGKIFNWNKQTQMLENTSN